MQESDELRLWMGDEDLAVLLRFRMEKPSWGFDLTDLPGAAHYYGKQCQDNDGALISLNVSQDNGIELMHGMFKYQAPNSPPRTNLYVGIIWIPFKNCNFQINVEAIERGAPGTRETAVMLLLGDKYPKSDEPPVKVTSAEELFARMNESKVKRVPADDEEHDGRFPDHALSRVRNRMKKIRSTLNITSDQLQPYRSCTIS